MLARSGWIGLWLLSACAPAYRPPAPFAPLLQEKGDANLAAQLGTGGAQLHGAYAVSDDLAVRAGVQGAGYASEGLYGVGTVGAGAFGGAVGAGGRWGVTLEGGGGITRGVTTVNVRWDTPDGDSEWQEIREQNSGSLLLAALRPEVGVESEFAATGFTLGVAYHRLAHDAASSGVGVGQGVVLEPAGFFRVGVHPIAFQGFIGLAWPAWMQGEVGLVVPLQIGMGLTLDLPKTVPSRGATP